MSSTDAEAVVPAYQPALYTLGAAVYAERDGEILVLKRSGGEGTGGWFLPGGMADPGEDGERCAVRELYEETGLRPTSPLTLIGAGLGRLYGHDAIMLSYACTCAEGDVTVSDEHEAFRWIDPVRYRDRYFSDEILSAFVGSDENLGRLVRGIRADLDRYISWRAQQP